MSQPSPSAAPPPPSPGAPPLDARPVKMTLPSYATLARDPDVNWRPACARCGLARVSPPALVLPCAAARLLLRTGAASVTEAVEAHPRSALDELRAKPAVACLSCTVALAAEAADSSPAPPSFACPACGERHAADADALVAGASSRVDAYLATLLLEDARSAEAWAAAEAAARGAVSSIFRELGGRPRPAPVVGVGGVAAALPAAALPAPPAAAAAVPAGAEASPAPAVTAAAAPVAGPSEGPRLRKRTTAASPAAPAAAAATDEGVGDRAAPSKRRRSKWGTDRAVRLPYESDKLVKVLYTAYAHRGPAAPAPAGGDSSAGGSEAGEERAASPDPRGEELARQWAEALAAGPSDGESLAAFTAGLGAGVDPALVGRRLDASDAARAALLERVGEAGRERIRALLLVAAAVLGAHERYAEEHGRNSRLWGAWRRAHVDAHYDEILEAAGFRLEIPAAKTEIYCDLRGLGEALRRFPGLWGVAGTGISAVDFVSTVPLLRTADAAGAARVGVLVQETTKRAAGYVFDPAVLALRRGGDE